ncbi:MAG: VWA domain-containing protein [Acidobacteriota bacterium]|jgi:VWFA-related protein|nr:VWA domain-containing protein [Acidobacteriota bacterium]
MKKYLSHLIIALFILSLSSIASSQGFKKDFTVYTGGTIEVKNLSGRVDIEAGDEIENEVFLEIRSEKGFSEENIKAESTGKKVSIEILNENTQIRIDVKLRVPSRVKVKIETGEGEIRLVGSFLEAEAETGTGTIYADVPLENLKYNFTWTASHPRVISDVELEDVKEKAAGRFVINGKIFNKEEIDKSNDAAKNVDEKSTTDENSENIEKKEKKKKSKDKGEVKLNFSTARGIVLLNVAPEEVPTNLQERPLTEAAKAIIRSGDVLLMDAIRRATPKYFGEYARTLPPRRETPTLSQADKRNSVTASVKQVTVRIIDINNRAIPNLERDDFLLTERGQEREILSVEPTTAPFNLVLLLDVSGSIENYVDFIRKAARNFLDTVSPQDNVAIVLFNEDVNTLSVFTKDRNKLSEGLDTFDAGGGTAYYDSLAYTLTDIIRPLKGDRTAIVILSDGDDNRSFLPFKSLLGSIQESGALIYPLYVPTDLIAASAGKDPSETVDPLRSRYMSLSSKANEEGETLAQISGGVYYPISRLSELQKAYDDIVSQLRTAYTIRYRSTLNEGSGDGASPKLNVKVKRDNTFVKLGSVVAVGSN